MTFFLLVNVSSIGIVTGDLSRRGQWWNSLINTGEICRGSSFESLRITFGSTTKLKIRMWTRIHDTLCCYATKLNNLENETFTTTSIHLGANSVQLTKK